MVVAEFSIVPLVEGSIARYVAAAVGEIENSGLHYQVNAMGTVVEGEFEEVVDAIKKAHKAVMEAGAPRAILNVRIDDKKDGVDISGKIGRFEEAYKRLRK